MVGLYFVLTEDQWNSDFPCVGVTLFVPVSGWPVASQPVRDRIIIQHADTNKPESTVVMQVTVP